MAWFLIVCTWVNGGSQCLALQPMLNREQCLYVADQYIKAGRWANARCIGLRR